MFLQLTDYNHNIRSSIPSTQIWDFPFLGYQNTLKPIFIATN